MLRTGAARARDVLGPRHPANMHSDLLAILACPSCSGRLTRMGEERGEGSVAEALVCESCSAEYPVVAGIPRFVGAKSYADSFGMQWNLFRTEQLDAAQGFSLSRRRFFSETEWSEESLRGRWILDAGCGAGRFLDVASAAGANVVGVDLSSAVDAADASLGDRPNVHLVQASIFALPFRPGVFDDAYSIGVLQHTPDPELAVKCVARTVCVGGRFAVSVYERKRWTPLYPKYLLRPFTKRLRPRTLLRLIRIGMPVLFPLAELTFRIPGVGRVARFLIPVSNYVGVNSRTSPGLSVRDRYQWAIMDTFDMFAPQFDLPQSEAELTAAMQSGSIVQISRTVTDPLCLSGTRGPVESRDSQLT